MNNQRESLLVAWLNQSTPYQVESLTPVSGDASFRRYFRFTHQNRTLIAVDAPPESEDSSQFIALADAFRTCDLATPLVYFYNIEAGFMCLEDFGDTLFGQALTPSNTPTLYTQALALIPRIQSLASIAPHLVQPYDRKMVQFELGLFNEWFLKQFLAIQLTSLELRVVSDCFDTITHHFTAQPQTGVHRDFHSRNLMMLKQDQIGVIDFQGAVIGPFTYDAASLLGDCYVNHSRAFVLDLLKRWHNKFYSHIKWTTFEYWFDMTSLQRSIKIAGIFCRLALRDDKPGYLQYLPRVVASISATARRHQEFNHFHRLVASKIGPELERKHAD